MKKKRALPKRAIESLFRIAAAHGKPVYAGMLWCDIPNDIVVRWTRHYDNGKIQDGYYTLTANGKELVRELRRKKQKDARNGDK